MSPADTRRICLIPMETVQPTTVEWLWAGRIPAGKLSVIAGDPGLGKSYLTLKIAAVLSRGGVWPDGSRAATANVLIVSAEDDYADTIRPRLDLLGADVHRITGIDGVRGDGAEVVRPFSLRLDLDLLREAVDDTEASIVIIDPLNAFIGGIDSHKAAEVRGVLSPLAHLAAATRAAILAVHHLNKGTSANALYRASGSLDFVAAARVVHGVAPDPDIEGRRIFVPVKCNISKMPDGIGFRIGDDGITFDKLPVTVDAASAFTTRAVDHEERSERDMAKDFIVAELGDGPVPVKELFKVAKEYGYSEKTIRRAGGDLHVEKTKTGFQGVWQWSLSAGVAAPKVAKESKDGRVLDVATFDTFEPEPVSDVATFDTAKSASPDPSDNEDGQGSKGDHVDAAARLEDPKGAHKKETTTFDEHRQSDGPATSIVSTDLLERAAKAVVAVGAASASLIAARCDCDLATAEATLIALELAGVISPANGGKARAVLVDLPLVGVTTESANRAAEELTR